VKKSKPTVDEHLDAAFASLDDLTVRELEATAEAIGSRRHPLHVFASIFRGVAHAREGGWSAEIPRFHLRENVSRAPTTSSPLKSRMPRRRSGDLSARLCYCSNVCSKQTPSKQGRPRKACLPAGVARVSPSLTDELLH
jgi:hypothetical protein